MDIYIYGINNEAIEINLADYSDYIAIYNRYLTDSSIYVDDSLSVSNIFPFETVSYDKYSKIYRKVLDNSFVDMYITSGNEVNISAADENNLVKFINQIKEEICASNENFVNIGYIYYYEDESNPNNICLSIEFINYAVAKSQYDLFKEAIRDAYQKSSIEIGVHYISDKYEYATIYETSFQGYYDISTKTITEVEYCKSDLKLFKDYEYE